MQPIRRRFEQHPYVYDNTFPAPHPDILVRDTPERNRTMALAQEDIQFIKDHLAEWLVEQSLGKSPAVYEI
jgi:hypothetical protein